MSLTHIAGIDVCVKGRVIQRCAVCGTLLCDSKDGAVQSEDGNNTFPTWEVGRLVRVVGGNPTTYALLPENEPYPVDGCIDLVGCR